MFFCVVSGILKGTASDLPKGLLTWVHAVPPGLEGNFVTLKHYVGEAPSVCLCSWLILWYSLEEPSCPPPPPNRCLPPAAYSICPSPRSLQPACWTRQRSLLVNQAWNLSLQPIPQLCTSTDALWGIRNLPYSSDEGVPGK